MFPTWLASPSWWLASAYTKDLFGSDGRKHGLYAVCCKGINVKSIATNCHQTRWSETCTCSTRLSNWAGHSHRQLLKSDQHGMKAQQQLITAVWVKTQSDSLRCKSFSTTLTRYLIVIFHTQRYLHVNCLTLPHPSTTTPMAGAVIHVARLTLPDDCQRMEAGR